MFGPFFVLGAFPCAFLDTLGALAPGVWAVQGLLGPVCAFLRVRFLNLIHCGYPLLFLDPPLGRGVTKPPSSKIKSTGILYLRCVEIFLCGLDNVIRCFRCPFGCNLPIASGKLTLSHSLNCNFPIPGLSQKREGFLPPVTILTIVSVRVVIFCMYSLVLSNPFRGFSIHHFSGFKYSIISRVLSTILSASAKFRTPTVLAILNSVQCTPHTIV